MFKKQLPIIFIGLCVVIAILVLSWTVFVKQEVVVPVQAPVVEDDEIIPDDVEDDDVPDDDISEIDTSDWKVYQNKEYGFEMKYPEDFSFWEALNSPKIPEIIDIGFRPDDLQGSVLIITILNIPLQELSTHEHSVYGDPTNERVKIDNLAGTKFSGYCSKMIGVQKGEHTFFFSSHLMREKEAVIFDQMLSTFKFIE